MRQYGGLFLFIFLLLTAACKRNDPAPVGGVKLTVTYDFPYPTYSVYTEAGWSSNRTVTPLRQDKLVFDKFVDGTRRQSTIQLDDLNAGNYVIVLSSSTAKEVQVTAGRENTYDWVL
jgi:hypothetical protein